MRWIRSQVDVWQKWILNVLFIVNKIHSLIAIFGESAEKAMRAVNIVAPIVQTQH